MRMDVDAARRAFGESLKLSGNTVKNYLANVFDKLKVRRRSQAAAMFIRHTDT